MGLVDLKVDFYLGRKRHAIPQIALFSDFRVLCPILYAYSTKVTHTSLFDVSACLSATAIQALFDNTMKRTNYGPPSGTINKIQTESNINDSKNEMVGLDKKNTHSFVLLFSKGL